MIVVDASAIVLLFGNPSTEPRVEVATRLLHDDPDWLAPEHWRIEVISTLRGLTRGGVLQPDDAGMAVEWLARVTVQAVDTRPLGARIWQLRDNLSAYDAAYVAAAEAHDHTLVTADARLLRAAVARCPIRLIA